MEYLAHAIKPVVEKKPGIKFLFIGNQKLIDTVGDIAKAAHCYDCTVFAREIPHREMPEHLAACDILVSPHVAMANGSAFFGSPVKIFEYMAAGKAIVASSVGQICEVLFSEKNALLVRPTAIEEIASAILCLASDRFLRGQLGKAARATVLQGYSWEHNAQRFMEMSKSSDRSVTGWRRT